MSTAPPIIRIHPDDDVVIARTQLLGGTVIKGEGITVAGLVPPGHKVATQAIAAGEPLGDPVSRIPRSNDHWKREPTNASSRCSCTGRSS